MEGRYPRQIALPEIGVEGQRRLSGAVILVAGCGALGTNAAEPLARAGIRRLILVDSDRLELHNLQRQSLVTEDDVGRPKSEAAAEALSRVNREVDLDARVLRLDAASIPSILAGVALAVDGLDNFATRYVLNEACVRAKIPWVFAAVAGTWGMTMPVLPGRGPCLRCLLPEPPPPQAELNATTSGLLPTLPRLVAAHEATLALRILLGRLSGLTRLMTFDGWEGIMSGEEVFRDDRCPCCGVGHEQPSTRPGEATRLQPGARRPRSPGRRGPSPSR